MTTQATSLQTAIGADFVFFDCDSTLSTIEGIDELARLKGRYDEIRTLTDAAMNGEIPLREVYGRRLEMLAPGPEEVAALAMLYRRNLVADAREVIRALQAADKEVFIVSGGLNTAVHPFGVWLGVPPPHIHAVDIADIGSGRAPLATSDGKAVVVRGLLGNRAGRSMFVGDGASDLAARDVVDLFVGYTGVVERPRIVAESDVLVTGDSLAPVLGLALTNSEQVALLRTEHRFVLEESRARIEAGEVAVRRGETP
ncbi:MAG: HAD-IB family phosphatase [Actinomycetota bacterium]|nr:HAD-IB family phosphatase [Actinomycetota bacterium]